MYMTKSRTANQVKPAQPTYALIDVVAASIMAFKANGDKIEREDRDERLANEYYEASPQVISNKTRATALLTQPELITEEARIEAATQMQALQADMTIKLLTSKVVSPFVRDVVTSFDKDTVTKSEVGRTVYVPNLYATLKNQERLLEEELEQRYTSQALGLAGAKVTLNFTLISKRYVQQFNCFAAFGKDDKGNLVSFLTADEDRCVSGMITGKVKFAQEDKYHGNAIVTSLNFVKVSK